MMLLISTVLTPDGKVLKSLGRLLYDTAAGLLTGVLFGGYLVVLLMSRCRQGIMISGGYSKLQFCVVCMCLHVCAYVCILTCVCVCVCVCVCARARACVWVCARVCAYVCVYESLCVHV